MRTPNREAAGRSIRATRAEARPPEPDEAAVAVGRAHREEWARIVAGLARRFGDLDIAEEAAAEAFARAVERWPREGVPPNPGGWLTTTAARVALDRVRREAKRDAKSREAWMLHDDTPPEPLGAIEDDRLRLLFTCCHPALSLEARVALTLRIVGGLTVAEIARAFLVQERTMAQRITRAKGKIRAAHIPYRVPELADLPGRIDGVLTVLYLVFNEGYFSSGEGAPPIRRELTAEAIRLARLVRALLPHDANATGLLALMLLTEARAAARVSADGAFVRLEDQDRTRWDAEGISEGLALVTECAVRGGEAGLGRYALLAAINAVHVQAPTAAATDWARIVELYERLERIDPSPVVTLNKAIAINEAASPAAALALLAPLAPQLDGYHAFHIARAEFLRSLDDATAAIDAYDRAIELAENEAELAYLARRRDELLFDGDPHERPADSNEGAS